AGVCVVRAGSYDVKLHAIKTLAIREGAEGMVCVQIRVIHKIEGLGLAINDSAERQRAHAAGQDETGVQLVAGSDVGLAVGEDDFKLTGIDDCTSRHGPGGEVCVSFGDVKVRERDDVGGGVIKLKPAGALTQMVGNAGQVVGLQFVQPK